jgi:ABC-2 type transport system permease protein
VIARLVAAEWLKLTRRPLTRILLALFLALLVLQLAVYATVVAMHARGLTQLGPGFGRAELAEYRLRATFPGLLGAVFAHLNGLGGIFAVIFAGAAMGSEFDWGTLRTQLARTPDRVAFLVAKLTTIMLVLAAGAVATLAVGLVAGAAIGAATGGPMLPDVATLAGIPFAVVRALFVLLPYVLVAVCFATFRRSLLFGVAGGLIYLVGEAGIGALSVFALLGEPWRTLYALTVGQNINTLTLLNAHAFGLHPETLTPALRPDILPSAAHATVILAAYCAALYATTRRLLDRDVTPRD